MKKTQPFIAVVLLFCLFLPLLPGSLLAAPAADSGSFTFIHFADLHLGSGVGNSHSPAVIKDILASYPDPAFYVCGGDMTELGHPEEYQFYLNLLEPLKAPVYNIPGNHESRWTDAGKGYFRQYLGPTYTSWNYGGIHFVALDSSIAKGQNGHFDKNMLSWLKEDLKTISKDTPVVFFSHHPVFFDEGDTEANFTDNDWELWTVIKDYNVRAFFVGHGHRQGYWKVNGIPFIMTKAAMEDGYTAITVDNSKQEMTVFTRVLGQNGAPAVTQELPTISLARPASTPEVRILSPQAGQSVETSMELKVQLKNWPAPPVRVEYKLEDNKWKPMLLNGSTWEAIVDLSEVDEGRRSFWVRAVSEDSWNYVAKVQVLVKGDSNVRVLWEASTPGGIQGRPVLGAKYIYVGDSSGQVTAFSQANGKKIWSFKTGGAVIGSPLLVGGTLYFGSADGKVYALEASSGKKLWEYTTGGAVLAQPLAAEGLILIGSSDFHFYALEEKTGQPKWKFATGNTIMSRATYGNNTVFFGSWDGKLYAVDVASGQEKWQLSLANSLYYAPAACNPLFYQNKVYINTPGNRICAIDPANGSILWEVSASSGLSNPTIFNNAVINSTLSGSVYALDPEGGENVWQYDTGISNYGSSPIIHGGSLLLASLTGKISSLNVDSKTPNWSYKTGDNYTLGDCAVAGDKIFIPTLEGRLIALQAEAGKMPQPFSLLAAFKDTGNHWARRDLNQLARLGLMAGYEDGSFKPDSPLTKGETAAILSRFLSYQEPSPGFTTSFADLNKHWAGKAIAALEEKGLISLTPDSKGNIHYKPDTPITRGEALVMLAKALGYTKPSADFVSKFADLSGLSDPEPLIALEEKGLISGFAEQGKYLLKPKDTLTRAQFGVFLVRAMNLQQ